MPDPQHPKLPAAFLVLSRNVKQKLYRIIQLYYTFCPGAYDHTVVAHFVKRDDNDDDDVPRVNWSNSACVFAPGYKIDAVSITTDQVVQGRSKHGRPAEMPGKTLPFSIPVHLGRRARFRSV